MPPHRRVLAHSPLLVRCSRGLMGALDAGNRVAMKAWMKREQWFIWIAAAVAVTMVLAATIGSYMERWWDFL